MILSRTDPLADEEGKPLAVRELVVVEDRGMVKNKGKRRLRDVFGTTESRADTIPHALLVLTRLCRLHYSVDEKTTVTKLPQPDARQREILSALGVALPAMSSGPWTTAKRLTTSSPITLKKITPE